MSARNLVEAGWFHVAVQALVVIARTPGACSSATIAQDVEAHAVFLRRVLAQLVRAGIVEAREGRTGGYRLTRDAGQITLADVYWAVKLAGSADGSAGSPPSAGVEAVLDGVGVEVEEIVLEMLRAHTLASVSEEAARLGRVAWCGRSERGRLSAGRCPAVPASLCG